jgi:hypothetical protein
MEKIEIKTIEDTEKLKDNVKYDAICFMKKIKLRK